MAGGIHRISVPNPRSFRRLTLVYPYFRLADFKTISHFMADVIYFTDVCGDVFVKPEWSD